MGKFINPFNIDEIYRHSPEICHKQNTVKTSLGFRVLDLPPLLPHAGSAFSGTGLILILTR